MLLGGRSDHPRRLCMLFPQSSWFVWRLRLRFSAISKSNRIHVISTSVVYVTTGDNAVTTHNVMPRVTAIELKSGFESHSAVTYAGLRVSSRCLGTDSLIPVITTQFFTLLPRSMVRDQMVLPYFAFLLSSHPFC